MYDIRIFFTKNHICHYFGVESNLCYPSGVDGHFLNSQVAQQDGIVHWTISKRKKNDFFASWKLLKLDFVKK